MPKLLLFAPCEKVLVDEVTHSTSLITILEQVHFKLPQGAPLLPQNALLPMNWSIVCLWHRESADVGVEFEQRLMLENDAGASLAGGITKWTFQRSHHRIVANVPGIPASSRNLTLKLDYRVALTGQWLEAGSFPLEALQDVI